MKDVWRPCASLFGNFLNPLEVPWIMHNDTHNSRPIGWTWAQFLLHLVLCLGGGSPGNLSEWRGRAWDVPGKCSTWGGERSTKDVLIGKQLQSWRVSNLFCFPKVGLEFRWKGLKRLINCWHRWLLVALDQTLSNLPPVVVPVLSHNVRSPAQGWRLGGGSAEREGMGRRGLVFNSLVVRWLSVGRKVLYIRLEPEEFGLAVDKHR